MNSNVTRQLAVSLLAALLILSTGTPGLPQDQQPSKPMPGATQAAQPPFSLGLAKYDFSHGPKTFPDLFNAYRPMRVQPVELSNSEQLEQMIHDGKLELSLQDAVELALANNVDIAMQRYCPWMADTSILRALGGGAAETLGGGGCGGGGFALGNIPFLSFDPIITSTISFDRRSIPIGNPFLAGVGTTAISSIEAHTATYNFGVSQGFWTGTNATLSWDTTRSWNNSPANIFNPSVQPTIALSVSQQLLNGFGLLPNTRNIRIARNNRKIADWQFTQQAITSVTNTITAYWELVYARENVKVQQQAVDVSQKLYEDNKKQLEIGTMAPLDVTQAESALATNQQNLIVAQTTQLQNQQTLKNLISKDPLDPRLMEVEIIPTDMPAQSVQVEMTSFENAVKEAFSKRPELQQQGIALKNADINVRTTRNALLPTATLTGSYSTTGLAGNTAIFGTPSIVQGSTPIVDANGNPIAVIDQNAAGLPTVELFAPTSVANVVGEKTGGLGDALGQVFHSKFPDYTVALNVTVPLRNRQAQADNELALLARRQADLQMQQLKNAAILDVRNTFVALRQDQAQVEAAVKARQLEEETFRDEQKKYELGASTVYNVILVQRDLIAAQGTELRALANLNEAKANFERAVGRTLDVNHVTIADAVSGAPERDTLIPGTPRGQATGTDWRGPSF
jgi:outer membrane protein TolC